MSQPNSPEENAPYLYEKRKAVYPKAVDGTFRRLKWAIMLVTLAIYYVTPWLRWDRGPYAPDQAVLVDMAHRRFYMFAIEIWPHEFYYVAGLLVMAGIGLFLVTSAVGRAWCGYACPQTVWTDLFQHVERWIDGDRNAQLRLDRAPWGPAKIVRRLFKWSVWLLIAVSTGGAWIFYFADAMLGRVLDALEKSPNRDNTIVVLWSDHGYHLGEHLGVWQKRTLFEESARAPLLIRDPTARGNGTACARVVEFVDIFPTLAERCGLPRPAGLTGRSLQPLLADPAAPGDGCAITQILRPPDARFPHPVMGRSIRTERWRFTEWNEGRDGAELYDHRADPREFSNLAADPAHAATRRDLRDRLAPLARGTAPAAAPAVTATPAVAPTPAPAATPKAEAPAKKKAVKKTGKKSKKSKKKSKA